MSSTINTFDVRRQEVKNATQKKISLLKTADRQARSRAREATKKKAGFGDLTEEDQESMLYNAEQACQTRREGKGQDVDTRMATLLDEESIEMEKIGKEEMEECFELLGELEDNSREKKVEIGMIAESFSKHLTPLIEKLERKIVVKEIEVPAVGTEEYENFVANVSNPVDVKSYLELRETGVDKYNVEDDEDDEDGEYEIEVVVSSDEEEDSDKDDSDDEMGNFII